MRLHEDPTKKKLDDIEYKFIGIDAEFVSGSALTELGRELEGYLKVSPTESDITRKVVQEGNLFLKMDFVEILANAIARVREESPEVAVGLSESFGELLNVVRMNVGPAKATKWNDNVYVFLAGQGLIDDELAIKAIHNRTVQGTLYTIEPIGSASDDRETAIKARCEFARLKSQGTSASRPMPPAPSI
ncbi:MAG: hypothetical protein P1U63_12625 [Coxiellaceae bacterium]|nr:hypothetical protein [Coxiellaceae bacterium]